MSSMSSFTKGTVWICHERQEAALCGQHALNNLVQSSRFSPGMLADMAHALDAVKLDHFANNHEGGICSRDCLERVAQGSHNVDEQGNFSIEVIRKASLDGHGVEPPNMREEGALTTDIANVPGFVCNKQHHWFAIRKVSGKCWNLNSTLEKPELISDFQLAAEMEASQSDGHSVFMVKTDTPPIADRNSFRGNDDDSFWWKESDLLKSGEQTRDHWETVAGSGNRLDGKSTSTITSQQNNHDDLGDLTEEEQMQMAMAASLETPAPSTASGDVSTPGEPPQGVPGAVQISFRPPNDKRVIRRFLETDLVETVLAFAKTTCGGVPQGNHLELQHGHPPRVLLSSSSAANDNNANQTIQEAKLAGESITGRIVQCMHIKM